jgi:RHS repeat-associated protein
MRSTTRTERPRGGRRAARTDVSQKRYRYTGKEKDDETGLGYHGARYYAAWLGRWERVDPAGMVDGPNRFAYCRGNPIGGSDSTGMSTEDGVDPEPDSDEPVPPEPVEPLVFRNMFDYLPGLLPPGQDARSIEFSPSAFGIAARASQPFAVAASMSGHTDPHHDEKFAFVAFTLAGDAEAAGAAVDTVQGALGRFRSWMSPSTLTGTARAIARGLANAGGVSRTVEEALELGSKYGTVQEGYSIRLIEDPNLPEGVLAQYLPKLDAELAGELGFDDLFREVGDSGEYFVNVRVRPEVLQSDDDIVNVLSHESYELNHLFDVGTPGRRWGRDVLWPLLGGSDGGSLHNAAVTEGNMKMWAYQGMKRLGLVQ